MRAGVFMSLKRRVYGHKVEGLWSYISKYSFECGNCNACSDVFNIVGHEEDDTYEAEGDIDVRHRNHSVPSLIKCIAKYYECVILKQPI